jgi:amino acid adenylation domain-containing protein
MLPVNDAQACLSDRYLLSYVDLHRAVGRLGTALRARGIGPGDSVVLFGQPTAEAVVALLAIDAVGATYVPLDAVGPEARIRDMLSQVGAVLLLATSGQVEAARRFRSVTLPLVELCADLFTDVSEVDEAGGAAGPVPDDCSIAYIIFTSGSTGRPKGVAVSRANVRALATARARLFPDDRPRALLTWPLIFDGSVAVLQWTLEQGGTLVLPEDSDIRDVRALARLIVEHRVTHLSMVPSLYALLLEAYPAVVRTLSVVVTAGESISPDTVRRHFATAPEVRLVNEYGPTECTVWASYHDLRADDADRPVVPLGAPVPGTHLHVIDDSGAGLDGSGIGELWVAGPGVALGYVGDREATDRCFQADHWCGSDRMYRTGDLVHRDADGVLTYAGRVDAQIKIRGRRVEPAEVEAGLRAQPDITAAVVLPVRGPADRVVLAAFVTTRGGEADEARWRADLARRVPEYMLPGLMVALPSLPLTPAGKVDRQALTSLGERELSATPQPSTMDGSSGPRELEELIRTEWAGLVGRPDLAPATNFFDSGGDSLLLARLQTQLGRRGITVAVTDMFAHPSPRELAVRIGAGEPGAGRPRPLARLIAGLRPARSAAARARDDSQGRP